MWKVINDVKLQMAKGDYGIQLPVSVEGVTVTEHDSLRFSFVDQKSKNSILVKDYNIIQNNTVMLEFTKTESDLFVVGNYLYSLDWYQDGNFMCNLIEDETFKVVDKV